MNDLISEFFYDAISRIPPGLLVVVLYWHKTAEYTFYAHRDFFPSPSMFIACIVGIAWLIGIIVEHMTFIPYLLIKLASDYRAKNNRSKKSCDKLPNQEKHQEVKPDFARRQNEFRNAVTVMIRGLCGVFLVACFYKPSESFGTFAWDWRFYVGGCLLIGVWAIMKYNQYGCDSHNPRKEPPH
jgi:hypothetical protein